MEMSVNPQPLFTYERVEPPTCEICRWWDKRADGGSDGRCRRNAPVQMRYESADLGKRVLWPLTVRDDWCGEYAHKVPA